MAAETVTLSKQATKLLCRLKRRQWYEVYPSGRSTPKAMTELLDAGLVRGAGRVKTMVLCYVPDGFVGREETWP